MTSQEISFQQGDGAPAKLRVTQSDSSRTKAKTLWGARTDAKAAGV